MSDYIGERLAEACNEWMESAQDKLLRLDGDRSSLKELLEDLETALSLRPDCRPVSECCAMVCAMVEKKPQAREYLMRAHRNQHCSQSQIIDDVRALVWTEFMNWNILNPMVQKNILVKYVQQLPPRQAQFQSVNCEAQELEVVMDLSLQIERNGDKVLLVVILEHVEIGVTNYVQEDKFQGFFVHALDIVISPCGLWRDHSQLVSVRSVEGQPSQRIQQQTTTGYTVGVAGNTGIPTVNLAYNTAQAVSTFENAEEMTASKGTSGDDKAMTSTWGVKSYANGKPFKVKPYRKGCKLPYSPTKHVCNGSVHFRGTWELTLEKANEFQYKFEWKIGLKAQTALLPRKSRMYPFRVVFEPQTYEYPPADRMVTSDFFSTWKGRIFS